MDYPPCTRQKSSDPIFLPSFVSDEGRASNASRKILLETVGWKLVAKRPSNPLVYSTKSRLYGTQPVEHELF